MVIILNNRLKQLRKTLNLTQQEFAEKIGVKRNTVATYEIGRSEPSGSAISLICREFNVNEEWLRTGKGDMFNATGDDELAYLVDQLCNSEDEFKKEFVKTLCKLSDKQWNAFKEFIDEVYFNSKKDK